MYKRSKLIIFLASTSVLLLLVIVSVGAYYLGMQRQAQQIQLVQGEQAVKDNDYTKSIQSIRTERDSAVSNYLTACSEYQKLNGSYTELYNKAGVASALPKYVSPDAARGNEVSCYR